MNSPVDDFEFPSFSLGLEGPSFSLGLDDSQPPTPCTIRVGSERAQDAQQAAGPLHEASDSEDMPRRPLKRLRRGSRKDADDPSPVPSRYAPVFFANDPVDDIEDFSSEDDDENPKLQSRTSSRSFSTLKPVPTPPVFEKRGPAPSPDSIKKTSLGTQQVKFQDASCSLQCSRSEKLRAPDRRICIDIDEDNDDEDPSVADNWGRSDQVAALLRERLPYFSFIDDLEAGTEPVYIDYRAQFGNKSAVGKSMAKAPKAAKARNVRVKAKSRAVSSQNPQQGDSTGRKGHWLTDFGTKVYVTADGQRLSGQNAYKRYMKDNGKLRYQKQKKQRTQKRSQR